ncbi:Lipase 3 domain-containing protein [Citrus sinensis]|uniref:Lipase 3 domain-containing protein n=1 Tax=Citrus sinensis TaxID=2711 RepID=A0ACB8KUV7_CITSI|nr:Lipase 3 domain-containing protein [Citrus sinensis]
MANEKQFCHDYLFLKPKEVGFVDLILLLFSSNLEKLGFLECPEDSRHPNFRRRWLIFVSVVAQKCLGFSRKPMAAVGYLIELWLNLLSSNGGLLMLLINLLKGNLVIPDRSSAKFTSFLGNIDRRVDLDRSIQPNDRRYYPSLSLMAAKLSYENEAFINNVVKDHWKMEFLGFFNFWNDFQKSYSTQAFLLRDTKANPNVIVVAFRGTEPFNADDWSVDLDVSWYKVTNVGKVHKGFMKALGLQENHGWPKEVDRLSDQPPFAYYTIRQMLKEILQKNKEAKFILTGHSLGGALAILFVSVLVLHEETLLLDRLEGVYTFGQPRVGDEKFGEYMKENLNKYDVNYRRYVYCNDLVPRLPYDDKTLFFKHFGPCLYFNSCYQGKVRRCSLDII